MFSLAHHVLDFVNQSHGPRLQSLLIGVFCEPTFVVQEQPEHVLVGFLRSAAEIFGNAQHLCTFEGLASYHSALSERIREFTTADVMRDFANISGSAATAGDLEKMSVGATSLNGVLLPVAVAARLTKAIVRVVQLCCDSSGDPEFISAAVTICTNLEMDGQIFVLVKIVGRRLHVPRRDRDTAGQGVYRRILLRGRLL